MVRTDLPTTAPRRPSRLKHAVKVALRASLLPTSPLRLEPHYLIIGAQRSGTTSLYRYLIQHPGVGPVLLEKGVHFFDVNYEKGLAWYRSHFPSVVYRRWVRSRYGMELLAGEASPYYLFHPLAPDRVAGDLPGAKLIVMLRDPVRRAYSQYRHEVDRGFEHLPTFEDALAAEPDRLAGEIERITSDPTYRSFNHQHFSYLARGHYLDQLERWLARFPRECLLLIESAQFFADPHAALERVHRFLGLPPWPPPPIVKHNAGRYPGMREGTRERLVAHFAEPNRALYRLLGVDFGWGG